MCESRACICRCRDAAAHPTGPTPQAPPGRAQPARIRLGAARGFPCPRSCAAEIGMRMPRMRRGHSAAPWAADAAQRAPRTRPILRNTPPPLAAVARACSEVRRLLQPSRPPRQPPRQRSAAAARPPMNQPVHLRDVVSKCVWVRRTMGSWLVRCAGSYGRGSEGYSGGYMHADA